MKISEFSKKFNITTDTIRYYITLGLIFPKKSGKQNVFDSENEEELKHIIRLKKANFSLDKIKEVMYFKKIIKTPTKEENLKYQNIIKNKINIIQKEIETLKKAIKFLNKELVNEIPSNDYHKRGVPIEGLELLICPRCHCELNLSATQIINSEILEGSLSCECQKEYLIQDGVIFDIDFMDWGKNYLNKKFNKSDYLKNTPISHIEFTLKNKSLIDTILTKEFLEDKNLLNLKCGGLDFLSSLLDNIDGNKVHFFMDTPIDYLFFKDFKEEYNKMNLDKKIIFFIGNFNELPLKQNKFNFLLDFLASSNYQKHTLPLVDTFLQKGSSLVSVFTISEYLKYKFSIYDSNKLKKKIKELGYQITFENFSEFNFDGGEYNNFFSEKNKARIFTIKAKK